MKVTHFSCGPAVNESERKAFERLKSGLISIPGNDEWVLLTNVTFSTTHRFQSDEIDIVAIGPSGVRVIEVKHWSVAWVRSNPDLVEQEADRVTNKARKIGTTLRKSVPEVGHVDGTILLTRQPSKVSSLAGKPIRGATVHTLKAWKQAVGVEIGAASMLRPEQVQRLARILAPKSGVAIDGSLRQLAGYVNLELQTPEQERFHRIYKGIHPARQDRVILHLYDLSVSNQTNAGTKARREYEALHRLQLHDWAPRILDSFQAAPGYAGEMSFFTVVDPAAPSLEERRSDDSWGPEARLAFGRNVVRALEKLHSATSNDGPMVHRNLTPDSILVKHDNSPILTGFDRTRIPAERSVASAGIPSGEWEETVASEVRAQGLSAADQRSDLYSLCACLTRLFHGREDETGVQLAKALATGLAVEPEARGTLQDLEMALSEQLGESPPQPAPPPARFWTEDQVVRFQGRDYRVVTRLGTGGVGTAFKVVEIDPSTNDERGTYVAKVVHDRDAGRRTLGAYGLARSHLGRHPALSAIFEVAPEWRENEFTALMTWIDGVPLRDYMGVFPLLAEDQGDVSGEALALRWLRSMCEALDVLHRNGLMHGDVSPGNMIVSGNDLVLTDYDFVRKIGEEMAAPGTVLYGAPWVRDDQPASPTDDIYALAASFFHVLFERKPFRFAGNLDKERGLNWEGIDRAEYAAVADFLDRATYPETDRRFGSVKEALEGLGPSKPVGAPPAVLMGSPAPVAVPHAGSGGVSDPANQRREERVEWLRSLLQSYPGSRWGNRETRGLDTPFARETYVETDLENALYRDLLDRRVRLVVLCGNAGDGKTALLQHLAGRLGIGKRASSERVLKGQTDDSLVLRMNLDGSASWRGRSADDLLDELLEPFQKGPPSDDIAHLLAINDGRLLEWIEDAEERRGGETPLTAVLYELLDAANEGRPEGASAAAEAPHIRFISLNQRSLVGGVRPDGTAIAADFVERLLNQLYGGEKAAEVWAPCRTCSAQDRCQVFRANRIFGPDGLASGVAPETRRNAHHRLFDALQAVHLRGETHVTMRELRAAMVYILFGVHFCDDYHRSAHADGDTDIPPLPYWDRAFDAEAPGRQGEVLRELVRFDPALEANPKIDRKLLGSPSAVTTGKSVRVAGQILESARRRAYFEWPQKKIERFAGDRNALDLARGRHYRQFRDLPIDKDSHDDLCGRLCQGISRLEILPPQALDRTHAVPLPIKPRTPTDTEFWVEKPLTAFRLEPDLPPRMEGLDRLHRQACLIYRYRDGREERLRLGADLFHLLLELSDGYQLGDVSTDDTFAHLSIFVQRLVREDDRTLLSWNPMREKTIYKITATSAAAGGRQRMVIQPLREEDR